MKTFTLHQRIAFALLIASALLYLSSCTKQKSEPITPAKKEVVLIKVQAIDNNGRTADEMTIKASN